MVKLLVKGCFYFYLGIVFSGGIPLYAQSNEDCLSCHSDETLTKEVNGKQVSLFVKESVLKNSPHAKLQCVACHTGFDIDNIPHKEKIEPINCLTCHKDVPVKHAFHPQMLKLKQMSSSPDMNCKGCHGTHNVVPRKSPEFPFAKNKIVNACGKCHGDIEKTFLGSTHDAELQKGNPDAPSCLTCHHGTIISNKSGTRDTLEIKLSQEKLCFSCHVDNPNVRSKIVPSLKFIKSYENSVHSKALHEKGNAKAATCIDCHTAHGIIKGPDSRSTVFKLNVPKTCSKCHGNIVKEYQESAHGQAVAKGNMDAPVCTNCHGEHNILKHNDPSSPVAYNNLSTQVCSPCHSSVRLTDRYGMSTNKVSTYVTSYHGLALKGGSREVANCASCHGAHNIKKASDPTSSVNKANLKHTCGRCHPGANENFAIGKIHSTTTIEREDPLLYWVSTTYIILIFTVIGGMFVHNFVDLFRKAKRKLLIRRGRMEEPVHGHGLYVRMTLSERIQHGTLVISFFTLVLTGFMLRFPDAWWVVSIRNILPNAFELRSYIHRTAAVVMVASSLYHVYYLLFTQRGRQLGKDLLPRFQDARDMMSVLKYNFGFQEEKPKFGRFSYIEKSEYWALVWGTIVMSVTGVFLWFDNTFIGILTKLGWDVARTVHYYEAWLAFLAIVVWHFYFIIFNPDVYPMNLAWLKGTITEEEMEEEHPLELEELKKEAYRSQTENEHEENN